MKTPIGYGYDMYLYIFFQLTGGRKRAIDIPNVKMSAEHNGVYEMKVDLRSQLGLSEGDPKVANEVMCFKDN